MRKGNGGRAAPQTNKQAGLVSFGRRQGRRHTDIPTSLPWLDSTAAEGKALGSSSFQDRRYLGGLARVVSLHPGRKPESPGKDARHLHLYRCPRVAWESQEEEQGVPFLCRLCRRQGWELVLGCLQPPGQCLWPGHVQHQRTFPMPPGERYWINKGHISC